MHLPDIGKAIEALGQTWKVKVSDMDGILWDAVLVSTNTRPMAGDYGIGYSDDSDILYIPSPFEAPKGRITIEKGGAMVERRIVSVNDNRLFISITLGEEA